MDDESFVTAYTDECERESQIDEQLQEEREVERRVCFPVSESDWAFKRIIGATSVQNLSSTVHMTAVGDFFARSVATLAGDGLRDLMWASAGDVRGTNSFFYTVTEGQRATPSAKAEWLCMANAALKFADGSMLLLSEYEADHVLGVLWDEMSAPSSKPVPTLCSLSFALATLKNTVMAPALAVLHPLRMTPWKPLSVASVVACALLNGETMFDTRPVVLAITSNIVRSGLTSLLYQVWSCASTQSAKAPAAVEANGDRLDDAVRDALRALLAQVKQREASATAGSARRCTSSAAGWTSRPAS